MDKIKSCRGLSFLMVSIAYLLAIITSIFAYILIPIENMIIRLFVIDTIATIVIFIFSIVFKNSSMYDPYWSIQPLVIFIGMLFISKNSVNLISILLMLVLFFWGCRLTINWIYTFQNLNWQDWRYVMLKNNTKKFYPIINFLGIHYFPTIVVFLLMIPIVEVLANINAFNISIPFIIFLVLALLSAILEMVSDIQMHLYRKNKTTNFIRVGLWKYARHPNYLGEILFWWFIALTCFFLDMNFFFFIGAIVNTLMFIFVSIPMQEKRQSRKEGYLEYKKETRSLLPIYKKP